MRPELGQIYRTPDGQPALFVRTEKRPHGPMEHLFVLTRDRAVFQMWIAEDGCLDGYELINDVTGRTEAAFSQAQAEELSRERNALAKTLRHVGTLVPDEALASLRTFYKRALCDN